MSRNGSGTYTLPAGNPAVTGTVISSGWANNTLSDIATEMTDSLDRSGKGGMLAALQLTDGAVGTPSLTFVTDTTLGFYKSAAGQVSLSIGGNQKFLFAGVDESTGLSLLGKGPVLGIARSSDSQANSYQIGSSGVGTAIFRLINTSGSSSGIIDIGPNFEVTYAIGPAIRFQIVHSTGVTKNWEGTFNVGTAGLMTTATYESGSFTATLQGCTTSPTMTVSYRRVGQVVTLVHQGVTATSNTTALSYTGLPAALTPAATSRICSGITDNGVIESGYYDISGTTVTGVRTTGSLTFTNSGTKGFPRSTVTYSLA
jgi:hypothetical protein